LGLHLAGGLGPLPWMLVLLVPRAGQSIRWSAASTWRCPG